MRDCVACTPRLGLQAPCNALRQAGTLHEAMKVACKAPYRSEIPLVRSTCACMGELAAFLQNPE